MVATAEVKQKKPMTLTKTFNKFVDAWDKGMRHVWSEGGTWASKTYSVMQLLVLILENYKEPLVATVSSESFPHLKRGCIRDFMDIMGDDLQERCWNKSEHYYTFPKSKCILEFVSADRAEKFTGGRRDILFCNEVNNIPRDAFRQADMRTRLFTVCDWNPVGEFWFHDENLADDTDSVYVHSTYLDALDVLPPGVREEIEKYEEKDPNWWRVYGLGLLGKMEGLVYPKFSQVDDLPIGSYFYGLDYGFASDPSALIKNVIIGEDLYSKELFFKPGLTNDDIARELDLLKIKKEPIYADGNEPKSAEELRRKGFNVIAVEKAFMRKNYRIQKVNQYNQHWTKDSLNAIKEQRNYRYIEDKDHAGMFTDKTTHQWSHCMCAREFALAALKPRSSTMGVSPAVDYMRRRK